MTLIASHFVVFECMIHVSVDATKGARSIASSAVATVFFLSFCGVGLEIQRNEVYITRLKEERSKTKQKSNLRMLKTK